MKIRNIVAILGLITLLLSACGGGSQPASNPTASGSTGQKIEDVHVILNWLPNVEFASLWVAEQKGWFKEAGIHLQYQPWGPGVEPLTQVPTGQGNYFGFQDGAAIIKGRAAGAPIKALLPETQLPAFSFTTLKSSGITTVKGFRGKRIGYQSHELYLLQAMLAHEGMTLKDVTPVPIEFDISPLLTGKVDAFLSYITNEPIALKLKGVETNSILAADYGYNFYGDVLFTTDTLIKTKPDLVRRFTQTVLKGWKYALANPDEVAAMVVNNYFKKGDLTQQTLELKQFIPLARGTARDDSEVGAQSSAKWAAGIVLLAKYKVIDTQPSPGDVFTDTFSKSSAGY